MSGRPLLCELHAHSTWSDGDLSIPELVDLYGTSGFDVLCVTDHVGRSGGTWHDPRWRITNAQAFSDYLAEIEQEAWRAEVEHGLLLVPGLELTYDDVDPALAAHAVAIGLRTLVSLDDGLESALGAARADGAALIAAHPYSPDDAAATARGTGRWAVAGHALSGLAGAAELTYGWIDEGRRADPADRNRWWRNRGLDNRGSTRALRRRQRSPDRSRGVRSDRDRRRR